METVANGPLSQLFALIMIPLVTALLLGGFLVFSFMRRRKKPQMKHGYTPGKSTEAVDVEAAAEPESSPAIEETSEINTNILSADPAPPPPPPAASSMPTLEDKLNLGLLSRSLDVESNETQNSPSKPLPVEETIKADPPPAPAQASQPTPSFGPPELLRLLRDPESGQLVVDVNGQHYTKLADIDDKEVGQYILKLTAHLLAFTNGVIVTDAGMKSVYKPRLGQPPEPIAGSSTRPAAPPQTNTPEPLTVPKSSSEKNETIGALLGNTPLPQSPPPQLGGLLSRVTLPPPPPATLPGLNLAAEINEIVQARLRYSPLAENNRVEIKSDLGGGIRINVNGQIYSSPDEVPDPQVKELIKASIKEWERT